MTTLAAVVIGLLIGLTGIGGVFLVPLLLVVEARPIHQVIGTLLVSFVFAQVVAVALYARRGAIDWRITLWLCAGAVVGGPLGARLSVSLPAEIVRGLMAGFLVVAGLRILYDARHPVAERAPRALAGPMLTGLGLVVGLIAGLMGVGGPIILAPVLLLLGLPAAMVVGVNQGVGFVSSAGGAAGHLLFGEVDLVLAAALSACLMLGSFVGARLNRHVRPARLRLLLGAICVAVAPLVAFPPGQ